LALSKSVRAAGGVVWRSAGSGLAVLLIHRPRYDDWSFPKGKAKRNESDEDCALREVEEEIGLACVLGPELLGTRYRNGHGRMKSVRYWAMELPAGSEPINGDGVDELSWLSPQEAEAKLTWERDLAVLRSLPIRTLA
jgi:8-oxo-dGTP diphosphatase